jgi:hypothetical protein
MANKKLSELAEKVNLPTNALIHILDPNDLSQSPQGSDFKFDSTKLVETATSIQAKRPLKTIEGQSLEGFGNVLLPNNTAIQLLSTGLNQGGLLTINTDAAKFNLSAGFGYVVNGHSDPDNTTRTKVTWTAKIANTIPNLSTQNQTYVAIDINGNLFLTNVPLTATQRRNYIRIGVLIHLDNSAVTYIDNQPTVNIEIGGQVQDILEALGFRSLSGNRVFPVSNNLKIKKELGRVFKSGANFDNLTTQPHSFTLAAQEPITFRYRTQTGVEGSDITDITPAIYDLNGTITPVAATATLATIQRVYIFQDGVIRIQPGQRVFTTLNAAITALNSDIFVTDLDIAENGLYLGAIVLTRNTVDLSNISQAIFAPSIGTTANGSVASPSLGYTAENVANKQNSLTVDGTGAKYTTVDAVNTGLGLKANIASPTFTGTVSGVTKSMVGLANIDNTSDANKTISTATQTALNAKISGSGTINRLAKFTASGTVGNSSIFDNGTNVGIGTLNPAVASLHLKYNAQSNRAIRLEDENSIYDIVTSGAGNNNSFGLFNETIGSYRFFINSIGNFGINQTSPAEKLDVVGNGKFSGTVIASPATVSTELATLGQVNAASSRPYKVYTALLNQSGTNAPIATVLENTLGGTVVWSRNVTGAYTATLTGAFITNQTFINIANTSAGANPPLNYVIAYKTSVNTVVIQTYYNGAGNDTLLDNTSIEIRVYIFN